MIFQRTHMDARRRRVVKKRGFALVASLTLMMLLGLVAVGILAVASSQNRIAAQTILQAEARQQALLGLDAAIAELQMHAGPDQRVTASSGIISENASTPQHILGVWNSWTAPLYGQSRGQHIQGTYGNARSSMFRRWLISSKDATAMKEIQTIQNLGTRKPGERICLVGEGTLGKRTDNRNYIYADLISMPASGKNTACFAWWVGGENQKANISLPDRKESNDPMEVLHRTWDTPAPSFKESRTLSFLPEQIQDPEKMLTMNTLPLVERGAMEAGHPYYFDITPYSYSLPTNVRDGGLKYDLNLLLNKSSLTGTDFARRSGQDCPLAEGEGLPVGTENAMPIGSWQVMHAFYNTWPNGKKGDGGFSARLQGSASQPYSLMSGNIISESTDKGEAVTYYDTATMENDSRAGYARTPVLMSFLGCWGLSVSKTKYAKGNTLHYVYSPMVMWWNPYNVQMRVSAKKLWVYVLPYRTTCVQAWDERAQSRDSSKPWSPKLMMHACTDLGIPFQCAFRLDWGNYFVNSEKDQSSEIVFEPGEMIAFTLAGDILSVNEVDSFGTPQECPFIMGDHPDRMTHFRADYQEYVNLSDPSYTDLFNTNPYQGCYVDNFRAVLQLENKNTPFFNGYIAYGIMSSGKQGDYFVTMGEVRGSAASYSNSDHTHVTGREAFTVVHGYDGIATTATGNESIRRSGEVDRFDGAKAISPASFMLGWYDYDNIKDGDMTFLDERWNPEMFDKEPVYYVAVGVVPKSYNTSVNEGFPLFRGKDYRGKTWQHSSPAFWGSALNKPDEQQRQYHPYQLAALDMGGALNRGVLDVVNSKNGVFGITSVGGGGGESVSFISCLELPVHPPLSLAGFAGMRLTPGWYENGGSGNAKSFARARRSQYQAGVPGVGIGNSFADPSLPSDDVYTYHESKVSTNLTSNGRLFSDFFDHGFIINDALWDRWFCSSVTDLPMGQGEVRKAQQVFEDFMSGTEPLPVSRYKRSVSASNQQEIIRKVMGSDGWKEIARYLMIEGGFNVNSVSEEAWTGILMGLAKRKLVSNANLGSTLQVVEPERDKVMFSRFMVSTSNSSIDDKGYNVLQGSASLRPNMKFTTAWGEIRALDPDSIRTLAKEIVKKVRERGPFLNMADFINRRLDGGTEAALTGALQAAIDATDINQVFNAPEFKVTAAKGGDFYKFPKAEEGSMYTAAPGYLIQSDVLSSLGNILTVRDDTFTVRAYGCVRNARNAILAQAWCEAVVQRTIDYVDPNNKPEDDDRNADARHGKGTRLTELNRVMGRKFRVVSFKWLDIWDI